MLYALLIVSIGVAAVLFVRMRAAERELGLEREHARSAEARCGESRRESLALAEKSARLEATASGLERRIAELGESNRQYDATAAFLESAVESAPIGIAFFGPDLRFLRVNAAMAALGTQGVEAHVGRSVSEVLPVLGPRIAPLLARVLQSGVAETDVAIDGETPSAERRRWSATCYPIRPHGRAPVGVGIVLADMSPRLRLEDQLRQAQKMEAVGRLAGGIAHDFNNALTIIQSYGELLAAEIEPTSTAREEIDAIRAAADRAATLARKLLAFSRQEVVVARVVDVNDVVAGMEGILRRLLKQGMELDIRRAAESLLVRCDSGQLEQVIMNLAINAVDAMSSGGRLSIVTAGGDILEGADGQPPRPTAVISVRDTGAGMSAEVQRQLFEPFFTTKAAGRGTGLGLATGYAIVRAAGGTIRVQSAEGHGSAFDIVLPRLDESEREPETRPSPEPGAATAGAETVLLVEDEPAIRAALSRTLRSVGFRVLEAADGGAALTVADTERGTIDLLLTDIMMPGVGGKELVQRFLRIRPRTRVILMSGYTDDEVLRRQLGESRYAFLQKPFTAKKVLSTVRELLDAE